MTQRKLSNLAILSTENDIAQSILNVDLIAKFVVSKLDLRAKEIKINFI